MIQLAKITIQIRCIITNDLVLRKSNEKFERMKQEAEKSFQPLFADIVKLIEESRKRTFIQINSNLTLMYWHVGRHISEHIMENNRADYGKKILQSQSAKFSDLYGNGFGERNLAQMIKFYNYFPKNILSSLMTKLTWTHFIQLLSIKNF